MCQTSQISLVLLLLVGFFWSPLQHPNPTGHPKLSPEGSWLKRCSSSAVLRRPGDRTAAPSIIFILSPPAKGWGRGWKRPCCPPVEVTSKLSYLTLEDNPSVILGKLDSEYPSLISSKTPRPVSSNECSPSPVPQDWLSRQSRKRNRLLIFSAALIQRLATFRGYSSVRPLPTLSSSQTNHPWAAAQSHQRSHFAALSGARAITEHFYNPRHQQGGRKKQNKSPEYHIATEIRRTQVLAFKVTRVWEIMGEKSIIKLSTLYRKHV